MDAFAALLERPLWELVVGASSLALTSVTAAVIFFWIGFRIAGVRAVAGFEGMLGLSDGSAGGNARVVPREVSSRLDAIKNRARVASARSSLGELAAATDRERVAGSGADRPLKVAGVRRIDE